MMQKINCPDCLKSFVWTDSMPLKGKCPTLDCEWTYDVHREMKEGIAKREDEAQHVIRCPHCHQPIDAKVTVCSHCDEVIIGARYFKKKYLFYVVAAVLVVLSLIYKFW